MRRTLILLLVVSTLPGAVPAWARVAWKRDIDRLARGHAIGISVREAGRFLYRWNPRRKKTPASVEKLLLSMALLNDLPETLRISTTAAATSVLQEGVIVGDLYILGRGDPTITGSGRYGRSFSFEPTRMGRLARRIKEAGVQRIQGRIVGNTGYYAHDWWAPGWRSYFPAHEIPLPSALTFEGNVHNDRHTDKPEFWAARSLTQRLEAVGVDVTGRPDSGRRPPGLAPVAEVRSQPLPVLLRHMNVNSSNFFAEVLGKRLAVERTGKLGTIARAAAAIEGFASAKGVGVRAYDSSGLSYYNKVSPQGLTRLLGKVERRPYGIILRRSLPRAGQGTLEDRLKGVRVRAKTGTLDGISDLAGWVWLRRRSAWAEFAIMSRGMPKSSAVTIENKIVRILTRAAR